MSSYVHRLSLLHGVSVGQFLQRVEQLSGRASAPYRKNPFLATFIRPNETTQALVEDLESVSDQRNLTSLTLLPLKPCVSRDMSCYARDIRWCASCLSEKESIGGHAYYKLVWQFRDMEYCPFHREKILRCCGACGKHQNTFKVRVSAAYCQYCHRRLSDGGAAASESPGSWVNDAFDLAGLVENLPRYVDQPLEANAPARFLDAVFDYYWLSNRELELYKKVDHHEMMSIIDGVTPVTLRTIRKYAYQLNVPIDRILAGSSAPFEPPLDLEDSYRPSQVRGNTREKHDHGEIFKKISVAIRESGPSLSLRQLASRAGVSVGYIENRLPHVRQQVANARQSFLAREKSRKWRESLAAAHEYFTRDVEVFVMSRKQALKVLMAETGLPKHVLRSAIRIAFEQNPAEV